MSDNNIEHVKTTKVSCDGINRDSSMGSEFGHPRVYYALKKGGSVSCSYCGKKFIYDVEQ